MDYRVPTERITIMQNIYFSTLLQLEAIGITIEKSDMGNIERALAELEPGLETLRLHIETMQVYKRNKQPCAWKKEFYIADAYYMYEEPIREAYGELVTEDMAEEFERGDNYPGYNIPTYESFKEMYKNGYTDIRLPDFNTNMPEGMQDTPYDRIYTWEDYDYLSEEEDDLFYGTDATN